jgi:hypothetical protein
MNLEPDPRLLKLVRQLAEERKLRADAERRATMLRTLLIKEKAKALDAKPAADPR